MSELFCFACGGSLAEQTERRRLLGTDAASIRVYRSWKLMCSAKLDFSSDEIERVACDAKSPAIVCRKCFGVYDTFEKKRVKLETALEKALDKLSLLCGRRRPLDSPEPTRRVRPRQICTAPSTSVQAASPPVMVNIPYRSGITKNYYINTPRRKHMSKALARGSKKAVVDDCFDDAETSDYLKKKLGRELKDEIKKMCSNKVQSILRSPATCENLKKFNWYDLIEEIKIHAPLLFHFLVSCIPLDGTNSEAIIGMCSAIIFSNHFKHMNFIQKIISIILYAGRAGKQVYSRLHKLNITISSSSINNLIKTLGQNFDSVVQEWTKSHHSFLVPVSTEPRGLATFSSIVDADFESNDDSDDDDYSSDVSSGTDCTSDSEYWSESGTAHSTEVSLDSDKESDEEGDLCIDYLCVTTPPCRVELESPVTIRNLILYSDGIGFTLCGDNVDKNVRRRFQRSDKSTVSLHYFNMFGLKNRICFSHLSDESPVNTLDKQAKAQLIMPSCDDDQQLRKRIAILISRVLVNNMEFFKFCFSDVACWHIKHEYYEQMSTKSVVVPLGILPLNENKTDEMVKILKHVHDNYIPFKEYTEEKTISSGETVTITKAKQHQILFGGDQLTAARMRNAKQARANNDLPSDAFPGIVPVAEDWHVKANFLGLIWRFTYSTKSAADHGSLYQLRNIIGRTSVVAVPLDDFNACDDFFKLIMTSHILAAAMTLLHMSSLDDLPKHSKITDGIDTWMQADSERKDILEGICMDIIDRYTMLEFNKAYKSSTDNVFTYAKQVLTLGCMYLEYCDAIREGDGRRVKCCLKYFLPMFIAAGRKNYAIEFFHTIAQHEFVFSPRLSEELLWTRFINVHGLPGHNIPKDLHMEHLNRLVKESIRSLQANKAKKSIERIGRALGTMDPVLANFDRSLGVTSHSGMHRVASIDKDKAILLNELLKSQVFQEQNVRTHSQFPKPKDALHALDKEKFRKWIYEHLHTYKL